MFEAVNPLPTFLDQIILFSQANGHLYVDVLRHEQSEVKNHQQQMLLICWGMNASKADFGPPCL